MVSEVLSIAGPDRSAGALLGAAVGDALGWPQEDRSKIVGGDAARHVDPAPNFRYWVRYGGTRFASYLDPVGPGQYSDDTQLTMAVARACLHGPDWWTWLTTVELPQWSLYERGGGGAVLRAARSWARGRAPWLAVTQKDAPTPTRYFQAGGNGVAMRIAPHALVAATQQLSQDQLLLRVLRDGLGTHGHPHALMGACLQAVALARALTKTDTLEYGEMLDWLLQDHSWANPSLIMEAADRQWHEAYRRHAHDLPGPEQTWEAVAKQTLQGLDVARTAVDQGSLANDQTTLEAIGCFDQRRSGAGTVAAVAALYAASRAASRPISGLLRTAYLHGSDTDTIASMTGSLLGAVQGTSWLQELGRQVQDGPYLTELARRLSRAEEPPLASPSVAAITESSLRTWTRHLQDRAVDHLPDGRGCRLEDSSVLESKSKSTVTRFALRTEDGQSLLIDKVSRSNPSSRQAESGQGQLLRDPIPASSTPADRGGALVNVEVRVHDLDATERFYGGLLGLPIRRQEGRLVLDNGLQFSQLGTPSTDASSRSLVLTVSHPDREDLVARSRCLNLQAVWSNNERTLWLKDPDGNPVRVLRRA